MFDYYGCKNALARHYQRPRYGLIIEPFAGSAAYSLYWLQRMPNARAVLCEKSDATYDAWMKLKSMSVDDIRNYHEPVVGEKTDDFFVKMSSAGNQACRSKLMIVTDRMAARFKVSKRRMSLLRPLMDRMTVVHGDCFEALSQYDEEECTWFIDPPYQVVGKSVRGDGYAFGCRARDMDFERLAKWCRERNGQVIVCEQEGANWLPFRPLKSATNTNDKNYAEVVWTNTADEQMDLFGFDRNEY